MEKVNRDNIEEHLFKHQLEMMGKSLKDMMDAYNWKWEFTMTQQQVKDFRKYAVALIMKTLRCSKTHALLAFERYWKDAKVRIK